MNARKRKVAPELTPEEAKELLSKISARFNAVLQEKNIKLADFAYEIGMSRSQIDGYRNGKDMKLSNFLKLIHGLELSPIEFFSEGFD